MSFDVSVAGTALPTDVSALKSFHENLNLAFGLGHEFGSVLDVPLGQIPAGFSSTTVSYTADDVSWNPSDGPVTFGLGGGAGGTVEVLTGGSICDYTDGLDKPVPKSASLPSNYVYLKLSLDFSLSANVSGKWSSGPYGVKASASDASKYTISFCKMFMPVTTLRVALAQVFQSFVLPFHAETLEQMSVGDFLFYEFDGNLHLAFGAYVGLSKAAYAGQSSLDVVKALGSPLATVVTKISPEVKAGATFDLSFQYTNKFEVLLSKLPNATAWMHLFRATKTDTTATLDAHLEFDTNAKASMETHTDQIHDSLVDAVGGSGSEAGKAVGAIAGAAASESGKYVDEANDKIGAWLKKGDGFKTSFQVALETTNARTILAGYTFDLASSAYPQAWNDAITGDFMAAFATGAVTLDAGSGMENEYRRKTCFTCNFFNLWHWSSWSAFQQTASLVYAGNNVFHLSADVGRASETDVVGAMHSLDFYFSTEASVAASGAASSPVIKLHLDMTAKGDAKATNTIATMLGLVSSKPTVTELAKDMRAFAANSPNGTVQMQISISPAAYANIHCTPYSHNKPASQDASADAKNWTAFAKAADDLDAWPLHTMSTVSAQTLPYLKEYAGWQKINMKHTGDTIPNRLEFGNEATSNWPETFPDLDTGSRALVGNSMHAGQQFMNFCAALASLTQVEDTDAAGLSWESLLSLVADAVKNDTSIDFLRPTMLAVLRLCEAANAEITGPATAAIAGGHFCVKVTF